MRRSQTAIESKTMFVGLLMLRIIIMTMVMMMVVMMMVMAMCWAILLNKHRAAHLLRW